MALSDRISICSNGKRVPTHMKEIDTIIVKFIEDHLNLHLNQNKSILISPLYGDDTQITIDTSIAYLAGARSPCMTFRFAEDVASPNFFQKLEAYLHECAAYGNSMYYQTQLKSAHNLASLRCE